MKNNIIYEKNLPNSKSSWKEWNQMNLRCESDEISITCFIGSVTMSLKDFDMLNDAVKDYRKLLATSST